MTCVKPNTWSLHLTHHNPSTSNFQFWIPHPCLCFCFLFLRQIAERPTPIFMSSREEISQLGIEPPTSSLRFGYLSAITQQFKVVSDHTQAFCELVHIFLCCSSFCFGEATPWQNCCYGRKPTMEPRDANFGLISMFSNFYRLELHNERCAAFSKSTIRHQQNSDLLDSTMVVGSASLQILSIFNGME